VGLCQGDAVTITSSTLAGGNDHLPNLLWIDEVVSDICARLNMDLGTKEAAVKLLALALGLTFFFFFFFFLFFDSLSKNKGFGLNPTSSFFLILFGIFCFRV